MKIKKSVALEKSLIELIQGISDREKRSFSGQVSYYIEKALFAEGLVDERGKPLEEKR